MAGGRLNATFYRNRGQKGVKFTREELQAYWQAKSTDRASEYQKLIEENGWSKADLARHLGVSRAWVKFRRNCCWRIHGKEEYYPNQINFQSIIYYFLKTEFLNDLVFPFCSKDSSKPLRKHPILTKLWKN
jgi:hypothetical protein